MKLELKNVKVHEDMSEETTCFSAALYANGKKVAVCRNDGRGAPTDVYFTDLHYNLTREVMKYCKDNPVIIWSKDKSWALHNVEDRVDELLEEYCQKKILKKDQKKWLVLHKKDSKDPDYIIHANWKFASPISSLLQSEEGRIHLKNTIVECQKRGYDVMNDNINYEELGL